MNKRKLIFLALVATIIAIFGVTVQKHTVSIGDTVFTVKLANTPALRAQGLSGTIPLEDKQGMLFVFGSTGNYGFWMKDMSYPLDFIWIDENKRIVSITENIYPESYPAVFYSNTAILYVLEVPAGSIKRFSLQVGDTVKIR
jgi:uncharacterized protein